MSGDGQAPGWARFMPGLHTLLRYDRAWLRGDVLAGLTVAAYLIPQVMAYAEVAGLPPITGLWTILVPLLLYAVLGSSRQLSVGPESTSALMTAVGVSALVGAAGGERYAEVAALLAVAVGLICIVAWIFRLGFLANLLSRPLLVGYLGGISVMMIASQLGKVTGLRVGGDSPVGQVGSLIGQVGAVHLPTAVLAGVVLGALFALGWWAPKLPGPLVVGVAAAAAVAALGLDRGGIATIGAVPQGLPAPKVPDLTGVDIASLLPYAFGIALVGYSENVLTARAFAASRREKVDGGQELLAMGAINLGASLFQGFPVSSSSSRTVLGNAMGSRTQLHSLVSVAMVLATLLFLGPLLSAFPTAALGAVVIYAASRLIDVPEWRRIARFRRSELVVALATTIAVVGFGVLNGILFAVALSILNLIRRIAHPHDGVLGFVPGLAGMHDVDDYPQATRIPGLVVYRYDSPLFFANSTDFADRALAAIDAADPPAQWFVLNAEANVEVDLTAVDTLDQLRQTLDSRGIVFAMARVKQDLRDDLAAAGFLEKVGADCIFPTLPTAVAGYGAWYADQHGRRPPGLPEVPPPAPGSSGSSDVRASGTA